MASILTKIVFLKECNHCNNSYDDREDKLGLPNDVCLKCNISNMKHVMCNGNRRTRCQDMECKKCFEKSFANHKQAIYWNAIKNNDIRPRSVGISSHGKYHFKCENCRHDLYLCLSDVQSGHWCGFCANQKRCENSACNFCFNNSLASDPRIATHWHATKNGDINPRELSPNSHKKCWFKCPKCAHDYRMELGSFTTGQGCPYCANKKRCNDEACQFCFNNSFASHNKAVYWHQTKNGDIKPRDVPKCRSTKYWFRCPDCMHDLNIGLDKIQMDKWCRYCRTHRLCDDQDCQLCFNKSFASCKKAAWWHPTKNNTDPRNVTLYDNRKYWFKCPDCLHDFETELCSISSRSHGCPYCANRKRCKNELCEHCFRKSFASHDKAIFWHSTKNGTISPKDISLKSNRKYWFTCPRCKSDFDMRPACISKGNWCRYCVCKTERKLFDFLSPAFEDCIHQFRADFCKNQETGRCLPFDFCIPSLKIVIELDGMQHFQDIDHWHSFVEHNRNRDIYKMQEANNHGYSVIRIVQEDVWTDSYDWKTDICHAIELCKFSKQNIYCSSNSELYEPHKLHHNSQTL